MNRSQECDDNDIYFKYYSLYSKKMYFDCGCLTLQASKKIWKNIANSGFVICGKTDLVTRSSSILGGNPPENPTNNLHTILRKITTSCIGFLNLENESILEVKLKVCHEENHYNCSGEATSD